MFNYSEHATHFFLVLKIDTKLSRVFSSSSIYKKKLPFAMLLVTLNRRIISPIKS